MAETYEWAAFREWVKSAYGDSADVVIQQAIRDSFRIGGLSNNVYYQHWVQLGKPNYQAPDQPSPKSWFDLKPDEKKERLTDTSQEPYSAPEGYTWKITQYDPKTLEPIMPTWTLQQIPQKEEAGLSPDDKAKLLRITGGLEPTPYQQAELDFKKEQADREWILSNRVPWEAQVTTANAQQALENRRVAQLYGAMQGREGQARSEERAKNAQNYEQWRARFLGELTDSRDWITKWQVGNEPNPWLPQEVDMESRYNALTEELKRATSAADIVRGRLKDLNDPLIPSALANPQGTEEQLAALALKNENNLKGKLLEFQIARGQGITNTGNLAPGWQANVLAQSEARDIAQQQAWAMPQPTGIGGNMVIRGSPEAEEKKPTAPPPPYWLPGFVPQLQGKPEIAKYPVAPPSGQMWQATPTSVKQGLAGYMDWAGQDYRDTLDYMKMMLPNNPSRAPAAWSPRR